MDSSFGVQQLVNFALTLALGLLLGMEREVSKRTYHTGIGGIRTFTLSSVAGYLVGVLSGQWGGIVAAAGILGIAVVAAAASMRVDSRGITTELALVLTGIVGVALGSGYTVPALLTGVLGALLLSRKAQLHEWTSTLTTADVRAILTFAVVTAVVLPILPDVPLGPQGVLNPRRVWMVVVLVTGISLAGYVVTKYFHSQQSIVLSAVVGSLVSSTAVTWAFADQSRNNPARGYLYGTGIVMGSSVMFARVGFYAGLIDRGMLAQLLPVLLLSAGIMLGILGFEVRRRSLQANKSDILPTPPSNPAVLRTALLFAVFYSVIAATAALLQEKYGNLALIVLGALSGVTDLDAITIAMSTRVAHQQLQLADAEQVIVAAMLTNTIVKAVIAAIRGDRSVRQLIIPTMGATVVVLGIALMRSFVGFQY